MENFNFIGIGKLILNDTTEYNIPHLHFILSKNTDGAIEAVNLEFGLLSEAENPKVAVQRLAEMLIEYTNRSIKTLSYDSLIETVKSDAMNDFWKEYRVMEFKFAKVKKDIGHSFVDAITEQIKKDIFEKYGIKPEAPYVLEDAAA